MSGVRGLLLILNVAKNRKGTECDVQNLKETFTEMGAEILVQNDPTNKDIQTIMHKLKSKDFSTYTYVAVALLCHGSENDVVATASGNMIAQKQILIPLCNIPSLNGKLKWLIMQTCKGNYDFLKQTPEGPLLSNIQYPKYCAKFFATTEGMMAYRNPEDSELGSIFIHELCRRLRSEYLTNDIISIFNKTRNDVEIAFQYRNIIQIPCSEDNFGTGKFYITAGFKFD